MTADTIAAEGFLFPLHLNLWSKVFNSTSSRMGILIIKRITLRRIMTAVIEAGLGDKNDFRIFFIIMSPEGKGV